MTKFKAWIVAIVVAVAGGATLTGQLVLDKWQEENMTCSDFIAGVNTIGGRGLEVAWLLKDQIIDRCPGTASLVECYSLPDGTYCDNQIHYVDDGVTPANGHTPTHTHHCETVCTGYSPATDEIMACTTNGGGGKNFSARFSRKEIIERIKRRIDRHEALGR